MTALQSIFLGVIQGLTEFLPVSSSGHLAILKQFFHIRTDGGLLFDVLLHVATLAVVFLVYRKDIWAMIREAVFMIGDLLRNLAAFIQNRIHRVSGGYRRIADGATRKFVLLILVSTIPTAIVGYLAEPLVTDASSTLLIPGICLLITAVLLVMADTVPEGHRREEDVPYRYALLIGLVQGVATMPGLSRSGTTIAVCMLLGFDRAFAVKYSFILSVPAVLGAALLEVPEVIASPVTGSQAGICLLGMAFAFAVGYICIKALFVAVRNKKFIYFAGYCTVVGLLAIAGQFLL